ncbi:uncharacterized protein LOC127811188 [Diospyros lotus]|uniref:uncharacterized protein LOC127811188 n=1 Tax=Diospyros lotus TaxID=55363 RepID=UPI00224F060B|nr:uncharacterized protein LOC127811188 [Diospyros lotus]
MRLQNVESNEDLINLKSFFEWIASIGDGTIGGPNDDNAVIDIPDDLLLNALDDPVASIVNNTYPNFTSNVNETEYLQGRAILAPTLDVVETVNEYMISLNATEANTYLSSDTTCRSDCNVDLLQDLHTLEFLNAIRCSGVTNHELKLKVGTPVMLLRNIDHSVGLCNGTRLVITRIGNHVLEPKIMTGSNAGHKVLIPRMTFTPSDPRLPFRLRRRQFPLIVSYAMTINKSQGIDKIKYDITIHFVTEHSSELPATKFPIKDDYGVSGGNQDSGAVPFTSAHSPLQNDDFGTYGMDSLSDDAPDTNDDCDNETDDNSDDSDGDNSDSGGGER